MKLTTLPIGERDYRLMWLRALILFCPHHLLPLCLSLNSEAWTAYKVWGLLLSSLLLVLCPMKPDAPFYQGSGLGGRGGPAWPWYAACLVKDSDTKAHKYLTRSSNKTYCEHLRCKTEGIEWRHNIMIWGKRHQNKKKGNQYLVTGSVQKYMGLELSIVVAMSPKISLSF